MYECGLIKLTCIYTAVLSFLPSSNCRYSEMYSSVFQTFSVDKIFFLCEVVENHDVIFCCGYISLAKKCRYSLFAKDGSIISYIVSQKDIIIIFM